MAVIGASDSPEKVGAIVLKNIISSGFTGHIYPVNPNFENLENLKCYKDVGSLPEVPDLVVIAVPAAINGEILNQIGEAGIKNVVSYAAGFKEIGKDGEKLEAEVAGICKKYGLNLLGPNCFGFVNNATPLNVTFGKPSGKIGNMRFVMQSGALAASLFDWCSSQNLGFGQFVTLGNKTVLNENDVLGYFQESLSCHPEFISGSRMGETLKQVQGDVSGEGADRRSRMCPIGLYLESISEGSQFLKITGQISKTNPIFILKPGKSQASVSAMKSHTGAIAGEDHVLDVALTQAGVTRCETLQEFFDLSKAFSWSPLPQGPKVAIVSNAGGPAVISCDAVALEGLEMAKFSKETEEILSKALPRSASLLNPVDVLGDALADRFGQAVEAVLKEKEVNALVVILTPQVMTQISQTAKVLGDLHKKYQKPIFCSFIGGSLVSEGEKILDDLEIPNFRFPEQAIYALGRLWKFVKYQGTSKDISAVATEAKIEIPVLAKQIIENAVKVEHKTLDNLEANDLISSFGIPTPKTGKAGSFEEAKKLALDFGFPVVLKLSSPGLLHKKEIGGVITDIRNEDQLEVAWDALERRITHLDQDIREHVSIQIQKEVESGVEVIVGVKDDPTFGKVLLFGAGGSLAELVLDRNLHLLPVDLEQAKNLVQASKVYSLLKGGSHEPPYCLDKLYELIINFGRLAQGITEISEVEANPVIVTLNGVWAVDGKVVLSKGHSRTVAPPQFKTATTVNCEILAQKYHYFEFETEKPVGFEPGQYISVKVASERINCYSMAGRSAPNKFNLLVDATPGGPGSKFFENLKDGDKVTYLGPFGTFTLKPSDGSKTLIFAATGSGLAPVKMLIESALMEKKIKDPVVLYWGLNYPGDVFMEDYLQKLCRDFPNFSYKIVVNNAGETWKGLIGFVTKYINEDFPKADDCSAYLSGNKNMIADVTSVLLSHGCLKERIYIEKV